MINHSFFMFIIGWTLWFLLDKHPASLGLILPLESDTLPGNFQLAFDMLKAGFLQASFVFIWKAHYIVISLAFGMMSSIIFQAAANMLRRRRLQQLMWPERQNTDKTHGQDIDRPS